MTRVYLVNPPFVKGYSRSSRWGAVGRAGTIYYPIWLAYATGLLEKEGYKAKLVDAVADGLSIENVIRDIQKFSADVVVAYTNFPSLSNDCKFLEKVKEVCDVLTVLVGPPCSVFYKEILKRYSIDAVIRYEFDFALRDMLEKGLENAGSVCYKKEGKIVVNEVRKFSSNEELDSLPFVSDVYRRHLDIRRYYLNHSLYPMVQIFTGRGCPNLCTFCAWPQVFTGRVYRFRSVDNVLDEFEFVESEMKYIKEIFIEDDTFTVSKRRVREFCRKYRERGLSISWSCQARADLDYETMKEMKKSNCRLLDVGYESACDEILRNVKKGITKRDLIRFTVDARRAGLKILADFVIGLPGETRESIKETERFIKMIKPDLLQVSIATPIPGTEFYEYCKKNGYLAGDIEECLDSSGYQRAIVSYPWLTSEEIERECKRILREYYFSHRFVARNLTSLLSRKELEVMLRALIHFLRYMLKKDVA